MTEAWALSDQERGKMQRLAVELEAKLMEVGARGQGLSDLFKSLDRTWSGTLDSHIGTVIAIRNKLAHAQQHRPMSQHQVDRFYVAVAALIEELSRTTEARAEERRQTIDADARLRARAGAGGQRTQFDKSSKIPDASPDDHFLLKAATKVGQLCASDDPVKRAAGYASLAATAVAAVVGIKLWFD